MIAHFLALILTLIYPTFLFSVHRRLQVPSGQNLTWFKSVLACILRQMYLIENSHLRGVSI